MRFSLAENINWIGFCVINMMCEQSNLALC